jgi:hypothetical protein
MAIPRKDSALAAWSANFNTRGVAAPEDFGLTEAQMAAYTPLHTAFIDALSAVDTPGARSKALVAAKEAQKKPLLSYARELYSFVQASRTVSDENKILIGVHVKDTEPTPHPAPDFGPGIQVKSVSLNSVLIQLINTAEEGRRGRPHGVAGASIFTHVGETAPTTPDGWTFEGNTRRMKALVVFDASLPPGTKVWFTAFWRNSRDESGPACAPVFTHLQGGAPAMGMGE